MTDANWTHILGIDIGKAGGWCIMSRGGGVIGVGRQPIRSPIRLARPDFAEMAAVISRAGANTRVFIEKAISIRFKGRADVKVAMSLSRSYGQWEALAGAWGCQVSGVEPKLWQKHVLAGVPGHTTKEKSITWVKLTHSSTDLTPGRTVNPHDGIADAVCIAEYGRKALNGDLAEMHR